MPIWRWMRHLQYRSQSPIADPLEAIPDRRAGNFADLPPEIIALIASFLPGPSAAALALCSHRISAAVGTQYWTALGSSRESGGRKSWVITYKTEDLAVESLENARSEFLSLLAGDLPDLLFCRRCALLHPPIFQRNLGVKGNRLCYRADLFSVTQMGLPHHMQFSLLQWVMKRHRMGLDYSEELQNFYVEQCSYPKHPRLLHCARYRLTEARIREGKVLLRDQCWFLLQVRDLGLIAVLARIGFWSYLWHKEERESLEEMMSCKLGHRHGKSPCSVCGGLRQCRRYHMEFQLDVKDFGKPGVALVVTTWLDLGECRAPLDPKWKSRIYGTGPREYVVSFEPGSIRESFEDGRAFSFHSIITRKGKEALLHKATK